jgi:hypothetical protein
LPNLLAELCIILFKESATMKKTKKIEIEISGLTTNKPKKIIINNSKSDSNITNPPIIFVKIKRI